MGSKFKLVYLFVGVATLLLSNGQTLVVSAPILHDFTPTTGPISGGTEIHVTGEGFISTGNERSICLFEDSRYGSGVSPETSVLNNTTLSCLLPEINFLPSGEVANGHFVDFVLSSGASERSNVMPFLVFDVSTMSIGDISPNEGISSSRTHVIIIGTGFLNTNEITCSVNYEEDTQVPATFVNSTFLQCLLQTHPLTSEFTLNISLNGQPSANIPPLSPNTTAFTFFASPPEILSCEFSPSYALLLLNFDREVEIGGENEFNSTQTPNCEHVFSSETTATLGISARCFWYNQQQRTLTIQLDPTSTVAVGSVITVRSDTIRTRYVEYSRLASGSTDVIPNGLVLQPIPVLEAPEFIPYCGNFTATADKSQNGGSRPLEYKWEVDSSHTQMLFPLQQYIPDNFSFQATLTIPSEEFVENATYTIQLTVRNFLGIESTASISVAKLTRAAPTVFIVGGHDRRVQTNAEVMLEGVADVPACLTADNLIQYSWKIATLMGLEVTFISVRTTTTVLIIPPATLLPNFVYTATLVVSVGVRPGNASVQLVTEFADIRARISGGSRRSLRGSDPIVLDATMSEGVDNNITNSSSFSVIWDCKNIAELPESPCVDQNGTALTPPQDSIMYTLPNNTLSPGIYNFTVTLDYRDLESSAHQIIQVSQCPIPLVTVFPPLRLESVSTQGEFTLQAIVQSDLPGSAHWTTEFDIGYAQLDLTANNTQTPVHYEILSNTPAIYREAEPLLFTSNIAASNQISLVLQKGILLPANSYLFRLEVIDTQGRAGFAEISIRTESNPLAGVLEVRPAAGGPLETEFTLRASRWTDDVGDTPLSYQFGFRFPEEQIVYWLTGITSDNQVSTMLPVPLEGGDSIVIVLRVYDNNAAFVQHEEAINLGSVPENVDLLSLIQNITETSINEGKWIKGLAYLTSLLVSVNRNPNTFTQVQTFKARAVELLLQIYVTHIPVSKSFLDHLLLLLFESTLEAELPEITVSETSILLESVVATYNNFKTISVFSKQGFTEEESRLVFGTYGHLISANSQYDSMRIRSNTVTESLLNTIPRLGWGLCLNQGINEAATFAVADNFGTLKASWVNLPSDYVATSSCENSNCPFEPTERVIANFGGVLFQQFLHWNCAEETHCSGVCIISAQIKFDLRWEGSPYSPYTKTPFLQLLLVNPVDGHVIEVSDLQSSPVEFIQPVTAVSSDPDLLECVSWDEGSLMWSSRGCVTQQTSTDVVVCVCSHLSELTVVERCPSGLHGVNCSEVCPQGLWGEECRGSCDCSDRGTCSASDGACDCDPGWTGVHCETVCPEGVWGEDCCDVCLCENGAECNPADGSCTCTAGWIGQHCNTACPDGCHGDGCSSTCQCAESSECDKVNGSCHCRPGYTGTTCHDQCPADHYGDQCANECVCDPLGTALCDNINGSCSCRNGRMGELCDEDIPTTRTVTVSTTPVASAASFPVWLVAVPLLLAIAVAVVTITAITVWCKKKLFKRTLPITVSEEIVSVPKWRQKSAALHEDLDVPINITKAKSLEVLVPKGKRLNDMFLEKEREGDGFKEPAELNGKQRWQIIQIYVELEVAQEIEDKVQRLEEGSKHPSRATSISPGESTRDIITGESGLEQQSKPPSRGTTIHDLIAGESGLEQQSKPPSRGTTMHDLIAGESGLEQQSKLPSRGTTIHDLIAGESGLEHEETEDRNALYASRSTVDENTELMTEVIYERGVYLHPDATLRDLRNGFIALGQLEVEDSVFQFLRPDGDSFVIDTEEEVVLGQIEHGLIPPRTLYIEAIDSEDATLELCVCGRSADLECTECHRRGYCSEECQQEDWYRHEATCQRLSAKRHRKHKRRKKHKRDKRGARGYTPNLDKCVCGKETEFECSSCGVQGYCSKKCQVDDWGFHSQFCELAAGTGEKSTAASNQIEKLETVKERPEDEEREKQNFEGNNTPNEFPKQPPHNMYTKEGHKSDTHSGTENTSTLELNTTLPPSQPKEAWVEHAAEKVSVNPEIGERDKLGSSKLLKGSFLGKRNLRVSEVAETEV